MGAYLKAGKVKHKETVVKGYRDDCVFDGSFHVMFSYRSSFRISPTAWSIPFTTVSLCFTLPAFK
jgi:hypothetical protein